MADDNSRKNLEKPVKTLDLEKIPGGDLNPFETPVGPTNECLSSNQVVSFIDGGEIGPDVLRHLSSCKSCRERISQLKIVSHS